jgi:hypothetical protein
MSEVESEQNGAAAKERTERSGIEYPAFGLSFGLSLIEAVRRVGGNEAPIADVMKSMGIEKVTDRKWAYGVPAAKQFGLVDRIGRGDTGRLKLTELGQRVALPGPGEEKLSKIAALSAPPLYAKLLERFAGAPEPPRDGLRNILHREFGIVESMAQQAADAFIDSLHAAGVINDQNLIMVDGATAPTKPTVTPSTKDEPPPPPKGQKAVYVPDNFVVYRCKITKGHVVEIPLPPSFTKADVKRLTAFTVFLETQADDETEEVTA